MDALALVLLCTTLLAAAAAAYFARVAARREREVTSAALRVTELATLAAGNAARAESALAERGAALERQEQAHDAARADLVEHHAQMLAQERARHETAVRNAGEGFEKDLAVLKRREEDLKKLLEDFRGAAEKSQAALTAQLGEKFGAMSAEIAQRASAEFLNLAGARLASASQSHQAELEKRHLEIATLIKPVHERLAATEAALKHFDTARAAADAKLEQHITMLTDSSREVRVEAGKLARALRDPHVRGRYGEVQLRRVAELAGMLAYCDFDEQQSRAGADGNTLRPDMTVRLPSQRTVIVDAKANLQAYIDSFNAETPAEQQELLEKFARHVDEQVDALARKQYAATEPGSPSFVVMFLPGEHLLAAAHGPRPGLTESAFKRGVILATPSTLLALLRAVAMGYQEQTIAAAAAELRVAGRELHDRMAVAIKHFASLGKSLESSVDNFNAFVGSYETRLLPTLKKFEEGGVKSAKELPEVGRVVVLPRALGERSNSQQP